MDKNQFSRRSFLKRGIALTGGGVALGAVSNASAATNSIVSENQLTGAPQSQWDLGGGPGTGLGQYSGFGLGTTGVTHFIEGYADDISVNHGSTINFRVNTDCSNYRIDIYRLGYYAGLGGRLMTTIQVNTASVQPTPLTNAALGLVDAGNWQTTSSWAVPSNAVSGVYVAHLLRQDSVFGENHMIFIVRDDGTKHDIIFQTSDPTWHAYNGWGGPSLYGGATNADARAYKVSYNRPFGTRDSIGTFAGPQDFLFSAEIAGIRWLEANGYDVCYSTGVDTDRNGAELLNHKIFLSVGHDEYWSGNQRANVEAARTAGVHLAFMSGNEVFWKTRWEPSTDPSATAYRTLVCYKETRDNAVIDPADPPTWTGSWRDPRFSPPGDGGRPENEMTGQFWTVDAWRADTLTIPYPMTLLRFWRNTSVATTKSGQTVSLVPNLLGYEWDESPDNGFRPTGLIHLSSTTISVPTYMIDYGLTDGAYTATHNLSLFRYSSGSIVFGAGTVFWTWGLDADHDLQLSGPETDDNARETTGEAAGAGTTVPVDPNVQQATLNLFADMGVQPATMQSGLVAATQSTDTTPPVSIITQPGTVVQQQLVTIKGTASDTGGGIVAGVDVSTDGGATWHPATGTTAWTYVWWPQASGTATIMSRAVDDSLNVEVPGPGISVTVTAGTALSLFNSAAVSPYGGANAPALVGPAQDSSAVELGIQFQADAPGAVTAIRFYKNPWNTGTHVGNLWNATGTLLGSATFKSETAFGWQQVSLATPVTLTPGAVYVVSYHSAAGNYSADSKFFTATLTSGSLKAPATGGNSVFAYGTSSVFPANSGGTDNYWADLVFAPSGGTGNPNPTANNDSGFSVIESTSITIPASTLLANDVDPNGLTLSLTGVSNPTNGTVVLNSVTPPTVTFTPTSGYPAPNSSGPASFNYTISNTNGLTATALVSLTVNVPTSSLFSATSTPTNITENDPSAVELGMKFQASSAGQIIGVRFYKGPQNIGTHVGNLWSSAGALLATVTFTGETASGWQQANFSSPVAITAGTTYVVSYHSNGKYSGDTNYFANAVTNGPLTAPSSASSGGNGVYAYGSTSAFPTNTFSSTNYWVDVAFVASGVIGTQPPTANNDSGFVATENTALTIQASQLLANDTDPNGFTLSILSVSNPTNGTVVLNSVTPQTVTFTPTANYVGAATFTYTITNGHTGGTASASVSLTVNPPGTTMPPIANNDSGFTTTENTALTIPASQLLANDTDPNGFTLSIQSVSTPTNGTVVLNTVTPQTVTFTPTANYVGAATFTYTITNGHTGGTASATVSLTVNAPGASVSLFTPTSTPGTVTDNDASAVELGVKFQSSVAGKITAIRFYKGPKNTGTHTAHLWSSTGTSLSTATFTGETASGWQQVTLPSPVTITANTTYVASYHTTKGFYSADVNYFAAAHVSGVLTAPISAGVYLYGTTSKLPTNTFSATNYWVDVVFVAS